MKSLWFPVLISTLVLSGCGGGDNKNNDAGNGTLPPVTSTALAKCDDVTSTLTTITTSSNLQFTVENQYQVGQSAAIIASIKQQNSDGYVFSWNQIAGPTLELATTHSPILAFEANQTGDYRFTVTASTPTDEFQEEVAISVIPATADQLNIRVDHQVVEGNDVSLRVDRIGNQVPNNLSWCVVQGPEINLSNNSSDTDERVLFSAPVVSQDSMSQLRAAATVNGQTVSDDVYVLITQEKAVNSEYFNTPLARTFAYQADSPYANSLRRCVYSNQLSSPCTINTLPLIGQVSDTLDKQAILDRVLVSHQWMGDNFAAFLTDLDPNSDFARLLQSVTAVVISSDIRPSFYWVVTGAIYLDPEDLWLSASERDTINEAPDYRADFGNDLQFIMPWRYVKNNQYASSNYSRNARNNRNLAALQPDLSSLLYHELAHANDFFPRSIHSSLQGPTLLDDFSRRNNAQALISDTVTARYPLTSNEMKALAQVSFMGNSASTSQKAFVASDITSFFSNDIANDFYAYSTSREDTAMLFEEAMMSYRLGVLRDVAITDNPPTVTADTITVDWGQRGRIADDSLQGRAALVIDSILPELDGNALLTSLAEPIPMIEGKSWRENLAISPTAKVQNIDAMPTNQAKQQQDDRPVMRSGQGYKMQ